MENRGKVCSTVFDDIAINKWLYYNVRKDMLDDVEDLEEYESIEIIRYG